MKVSKLQEVYFKDSLKLLMLFAFTLIVQELKAQYISKVVYLESNRLTYVSDDEGNRIPDFSNAGYKGGGVALPTVPVSVTISAITGDNTAHIQAAINQVAALTLGSNGIRGAVKLNAGRYEINGTLYLNASGVVLRGAGDGSDLATNTVLVGKGDTPDKRTIIVAGGTREAGQTDEVPGTRNDIISDFLPVGSRSFLVNKASSYAVGNNIIVTHPSTQQWLNAINGGDTDKDSRWNPGDADIVYNRNITAINGNVITIDAPLFNHFDRSLSQSYIEKHNRTGLVTNVGIESLRIDIEATDGTTNPDGEENHAYNGVQFNMVENAWATSVTTLHFVESAIMTTNATFITVTNCKALDPVSVIEGSKRYNFHAGKSSNNILFTGCHSTNGRHDYTSNGTTYVSGIVFTNCTSDLTNDTSEGHRRWSQGMLYDNMTFTNPRSSKPILGLYNRGSYGSGHGWSAVHSVAWNVRGGAKRIIIQKPPTGQNYGIGCVGELTHDDNELPFIHPAGFIEGINQTPAISSLYQAQLQDRLTYGVIPDAPARLQAKIDVTGTILTWTALSPNETSYLVERSVNAGLNYTLIATLAANTTTYTDPSLTGTRQYRVRVSSNTGKSAYGNTAIAIAEEAGQSTEILPEADAFVRGGTYSTTNYGSQATLEVKNGNGDTYDRQALMRFNLSGITGSIVSAKLKIYARMIDLPTDLKIYIIENQTWGEGTVNWTNQPARGEIISHQVINDLTYKWYEIDVSNYIRQQKQTSGKASFAFWDPSAADYQVQINSKESATNKPVLIVRYGSDSNLALGPVADSYVNGGSDSTVNYGSATTIRLKEDNINENVTRWGFVKFDLSGVVGQVSHAVLKVKARSAEPATISVYDAADAWTETAVKWTNKPKMSSTIGSVNIASSVSYPSTYYEIDVTDYINGQLAGDKTVSLGFRQGTTDEMVYIASKEDATELNRPVLEISSVGYGPLADANVQMGDNSTTNFGSQPTIQVKSSSSVSLRRYGILKFHVGNVTGELSKAVVKVKAKYSGTTVVNLAVHKVGDDTWQELLVNGSNQPARGAEITRLNFSNSPSYPSTYAEIDVTDYVREQLLASDKMISLGLLAVNNTEEILMFASKEDLLDFNRPVLELKYGDGESLNDLSMNKRADTKLNNLTSIPESSQFTVYPNPSNGTDLTVNIPGMDAEAVEIQLYDLNGRQYFINQEVNPGHRKLVFGSKLRPGVYVLNIAGLGSKKIIVAD